MERGWVMGVGGRWLAVEGGREGGREDGRTTTSWDSFAVFIYVSHWYDMRE